MMIENKFAFSALPKNLYEMQQMPEASMDDPYKTAALTVCALCVYGEDKQAGIDMLNWLKGPVSLSAFDISFLDDRFRGGNTCVPYSYFQGAVPDNDYTPSQPYMLTIEEGPYADAVSKYKKLHIRSGGADSAREVLLRLGADGKWYLWNQFLMLSIRTPRSKNPWA